MTSTVQVLSMAVASHRFMTYHGTGAPRAGATIELGDRVAEPGGFGCVYAVRAIDGSPPSRRLVAKVYDPAVVGSGEAIVRATQGLIAALENQNPQRWPERLLALPFWLAQSTLDGEPRLVALMLDLNALGYEPCSFDPGFVPEYRRRPMADRLHLAESIAATAEIFEQIRYLHSDMNPENCLIHLSRGDAQIIDLDAGVIMATGRERPLSEGKPDEFLPPETRFATMAPHTPGSPNPFGLEAERWSVASMVGYLIFAVSPGFFLVNLAPQTLEAYARSGHAWPDIDRSSHLFTRLDGNRRAYDALRDEFVSVPASVGDLFRQFFHAATNGAERPTATQWREGLLDLHQPPQLHAFLVSPNVATVGEPVQLSWLTTNTSHVDIEGLGRLAPTGTATITATQTTTFVITLVNPFGAMPVTGPRLDVIGPPPDIEITVPPCPIAQPPAAARSIRVPSGVWDEAGRDGHRRTAAVVGSIPRFGRSPIPHPGPVPDRAAERVGRPARVTFTPPARPSAPTPT